MSKDFKQLQLPKVRAGRDYSAIDPLDSRYYDPEVAKYLSERTRIACQAHVEAALAHTLADFGVCSSAIANQIEGAAAKISAEDVYAEEQNTKHDIRALVNCIRSHVSPDAQGYVHFGATSYDIIATANALQMKVTIEGLLLPRLTELLDTLSGIAKTYASTTQIGRTHGQHALPITFGFTIAEYVNRISQSVSSLKELDKALQGKFSGAVGAYNASSTFIDKPFEFEAMLLSYLNLKAAPYSTQIIPPENMIRVLDELTIVAGIMANLAHDMRHLQRTEIAEVRERFEKGQVGSSTMAHKRNPWNFENVVSMSKQVIAQNINAKQNLSSEHQRDLTDSASARFYAVIPATVSAMVDRLNRIMTKLEIDPVQMEKNLNMTGGAIAAEPLYLLLAKYKHPNPHEKSKELAHTALDGHAELVDTINADKEMQQYWPKFSKIEKLIIENPTKYYSGLAKERTLQVVKQWKKDR